MNESEFINNSDSSNKHNSDDVDQIKPIASAEDDLVYDEIVYENNVDQIDADNQDFDEIEKNNREDIQSEGGDYETYMKHFNHYSQRRHNTTTHFQVIFVDDGSTDTTINVVLSYMRKYRFTHELIVLQISQNRGLFNARLCAYEELNYINFKLEYSTIVDSDDQLHDKNLLFYVSNIINNYQSNNDTIIDIVKFTSMRFTQMGRKLYGGKLKSTVPFFNGFIKQQHKEQLIKLSSKHQIHCYIWGSFYRSQLLTQLLEETYYLREYRINQLEDLLQVYPLLTNAKNYYGIPNVLGYRYFVRKDSMMNKANPNNFLSAKTALISYQHFTKYKYYIGNWHASHAFMSYSNKCLSYTEKYDLFRLLYNFQNNLEIGNVSQ